MMPLPQGYFLNSSEGGIPVSCLEEAFAAEGRTIFRTGSINEPDFLDKLELVFETETSEYEREQLEDAYYFLIGLAKRILARLKAYG